MTSPQLPLVDTGNHLLAEVPALLTTGFIQTGLGQRLALTVRTHSTTLTVLLTQADAKTWAKQLADTASQMSASGLIIGNGSLPPGSPGAVG